MSLIDSYKRKFHQAMAPAVDYQKRSIAAKAMGRDYSKMSPEEIAQRFGNTGEQIIDASNDGSSSILTSMVNQEPNPYLQGLAPPPQAYSMSTMVPPSYSVSPQAYTSPQAYAIQPTIDSTQPGYPTISSLYSNLVQQAIPTPPEDTTPEAPQPQLDIGKMLVMVIALKSLLNKID